MVQSELYKRREYFLYAKKTKITTLFNISCPLHHHSAILESIRWMQTVYTVVIFVFFAYRKYSRSFITLRLNHCGKWTILEMFFHTFLGLDSVIYLGVNGTVTASRFHPNILNCVPKMNEAFMGLERHGGKWLMTIFILGWSNALIHEIWAERAGHWKITPCTNKHLLSKK